MSPAARTRLVPVFLATLLGCVGAIEPNARPGPAAGEIPPAGPGGAGPGAPGDAPRVTPGPVAPGGPLPSAALAAVSGLRRLTQHEYDNTLRDLLGDDSRPARQLLPEDPRKVFDNDHSTQVASKALIEGLDLAAREAVERLLADPPRRDAVVGCKPAGPEDAGCFRAFAARVGRRALRRPLAAEELARLEGAFMPLAAEARDFHAAAGATLATLLQHPELVYRVEIGAPVPGQPGLFRLGAFELAARLSYTLWAGPPDDPLLDAARGGALATPEGVRGAAARMLADQRALAQVARFHALWMGYEGQPLLPRLAPAMQAETAALLERVIFRENLPWQDLLRFEETFVDDALAKHYGLAPVPGGGARWVPYGASPRRGILSHASFLSVGAKPEDTSPTMRGLAVRTRLLCQEVPPPPPGVDSDLPPASTTPCKQDRYRAHAAGGCAACHSLMDPLGLALENYDQTGRYRTTEAKNPACVIEGTGELPGLGTFRGPAELGALLIRGGGLEACAATQLVRYATGHTALDDADARLAAALAARAGRGFRFEDLLLDLVSSEAFRHRK